MVPISSKMWMALRNLGRNPRRTISTMVAIAIGIVGLTFLNGFVSYSMWGLQESIIRGGLGHVQLALNKDYFDQGESNPFPYIMPESKSLAKIIRKQPEVRAVFGSIRFEALLAVGEKLELVRVLAEPRDQAKEAFTFRSTREGPDFDPELPGQVFLGNVLARRLGIEPGESVSITAVSASGFINTMNFVVGGTTSTGIAEVDGTSLTMDLPDAHGLLQSDGLPLLTIVLDRSADTESFAAGLKVLVKDKGNFSIRTWEELSPYYRQAEDSYLSILRVAQAIVMLVALFSISATLSLAIMERQKEMGTLKAFGTRRTDLLFMLLAEGLFMGLLGTIFGSALAWGASSLVNSLGGISLGAQPGMSRAISILIEPEASTYPINGALVLLAAFLGSLGPGFHVIRQNTARLLSSPS